MAQFIHLLLLLGCCPVLPDSIDSNADGDDFSDEHRGEDMSAQACNDDDIGGLKFYEQAKSWIDALEHCHSYHSSLVQITEPKQQNAVSCLLQKQKARMRDGAWIGLERSIFGKNVPWMWTSGSQVEGKDQWNGSFVDPLNNHCGKIVKVQDSTFKWLDANCHDELPFICQEVSVNERPCHKYDTPGCEDPT